MGYYACLIDLHTYSHTHTHTHIQTHHRTLARAFFSNCGDRMIFFVVVLFRVCVQSFVSNTMCTQKQRDVFCVRAETMIHGQPQRERGKRGVRSRTSITVQCTPDLPPLRSRRRLIGKRPSPSNRVERAREYGILVHATAVVEPVTSVPNPTKTICDTGTIVRPLWFRKSHVLHEFGGGKMKEVLSMKLNKSKTLCGRPRQRF